MTLRTMPNDNALAFPETILYAFVILKQLNERERDFLIHARLGHIPKRTILKMKKNGTKGLELYSGKFDELCKPCLQAKHRAENHGQIHARHPDGLPGQHLHFDLAVVSKLDSNGNKYVLTVVDEISSEIVITLLKTKTAEAVHRVAKKIQLIITARTGNKLLTWQFDRGSEFLNAIFEQWMLLELGVEQKFSNVEHPWENGKAERPFQTIFALARSLLKHADLPIKMWGKAILHSVYIMNRTPVSNTGGIAPLQYRTKASLDLSNMRVFGSPAQIHVRATIRADKKLADRSVSGTFVGHSSHGNGYIFQVPKTIGNSQKCLEIDSTDVKFNETFSPCRERQGKLTPGNAVDPDLTTENVSDEIETSGNKQDGDGDNDDESDLKEASTNQEYGRGKRKSIL
jgi:transposase InsO family protein